MKRYLIYYTLSFLLLLYSTTISYALSVKTHEAINEYIALNTLNGFSLNDYLNKNLGFSDGSIELINDKEIYKWLRDGGRYEDIPAWYLPYVRSANHFHNPLITTLGGAGFTGIWGTEFVSGESAILWSQKAIGTQSPGGYYSWLDVRDYYYKALTATDKTIRDTNFAQAFRGMGQLMHLVQDMSVPEHSRNDGHYLPTYEEYVRDNSTVLSAAIQSPFFFNISALNQPSKFTNAPVPIANLFDTNQYNGSNPNDTVSNTIGLSEYSNANFVSPQTLFKDFTYPSKTTSVQITDYDFPDPFNIGTYVKRQYYKKVADGETNQGNGFRLAGVDYLKFYRDANLSPTQADQIMVIPPMDDYVYSDYASLLLPRAVGYSAGLLNYFFRGTLEITAPDTYVYSIIDGSANPQQFTKIKAKVRNTTPNEQIQAGVLQAVAKYKKRTDYAPDLSTDPPTQTSREPEYSYSVSAQWTLSSTEISSINTAPTEFTFDFTNNPIPAGITDLYLIVIFKGTLGNEIDTAIAAGMKDIIEPTHHVIWNLTDMVVLYYQEANDPAPRYHLYTENEIRSRPELESIVRQNNIWAAYLRPHDMTIRVSYLGTYPPQGYVNPIAEAVLPGGRHIRLIMLLDRENNNYMRVTSFDSVYDNDQGSFLPSGCVRTEILVGVGDDIYNGQYRGLYCDSIFSSAGYQERDGVFRYQEASVFRTFKQHLRSLGKIWISPIPSLDERYYPDEESIPADTTPYQATINFP